MHANTILLPNKDGSQTLILGPSGEPKSMLSDLAPAERAALNEWSIAQSGNPERGGAIDLMQWPGWGEVLTRRIKELAAASKTLS